MSNDAQIIATLSRKDAMSAESVALALGYDPTACRWVVPALNAAREEGRVVRVSVNEKGNVHWKLP
jgi:hypothetical protein